MPADILPCHKANMRVLVDTLRSGYYPQGRNRLRQASRDGVTTGWCCLGVACDLAAVAGAGSWLPPSVESEGAPWIRYLDTGWQPADTGHCSAMALTEDAAAWLGLTQASVADHVRGAGYPGDSAILDLYRNLYLGVSDGMVLTASALNDAGMSFPEIADRIEAAYGLAS
jgi:hypothetical protein